MKARATAGVSHGTEAASLVRPGPIVGRSWPHTGRIRLEALVGVVGLALAVYCLIDVIRTPDVVDQHLPTIAWLVLALLFAPVGSVARLVAGRPRTPMRSAPTSAFPEYDRPGRTVAGDPETDAAFLRQVRERAEAQRARYREEQRRREQG